MNIPKLKIKVSLQKGDTFKIKNSTDCFNVVSKLFDKNTLYFTEEMILLAVNNNNEVYGWYRLSYGGRTGTVCDARVIFTILLNCGACGFVLAHNHPSQNIQPSEQDIRLTKDLIKFGELINIKLLDHLIVGANNYTSMKDEGII